MTESEAQKWLEKFEWDDSEETSEALGTICEALQEYPKFRAIGTVEELQSMKENGAFTGVELSQIVVNQMKLKKYMEIGTVEEIKALKENGYSDGYKKAIDDFVTRAYQKLGCSEKELFCSDVIDKIAEQMKGGTK